MSDTKLTGWRRDISIAALPLAAVVAASALGQYATLPNLVPWYAGLDQAVVQSAELGVRAGVDHALCIDGVRAFRMLKLAPSPAAARRADFVFQRSWH